MTADNAWRQRRAAELFGLQPVGGAIDDVLPLVRPAAGAPAAPVSRPPPVSHLASPSAARIPVVKAPSRLDRPVRWSWWRVVVAVLLVAQGAAVAWLLVARSRPQIIVVRTPAAAVPATPPVPPTTLPPASPAAAPPVPSPVVAPSVPASVHAVVPTKRKQVDDVRSSAVTTRRQTRGVAVGSPAPAKILAQTAAPVLLTGRGSAPPLPRDALPVPRPTTPALPGCDASGAGAAGTACANGTVEARDHQVEAALATLATLPDRRVAAKARRGQGRFLHRLDRCHDDACLAAAYDDRLAELDALRMTGAATVAAAPAAAATPPLPVCEPGEYHRLPVHCRESRLRQQRPAFISQ